MDIIASPWHYTPWQGAIDTYDNLQSQVCYPNGINMTDLNDLLWFEPEYCYDLVGLNYDSENGEILD